MNDRSAPEPSAHALPVLQGSECLAFRCSACGKCCKELRVTVTHHDLRRLQQATGQSRAALVDWLSPEDVDMTGEPESFVELGAGRRLMVLAQENGACHLLGEDNRCRTYRARPMDCRLYPFNIERERDEEPPLLSILPSMRPDYARDSHVDAAELLREDAARWRELAEYQALVASWNRLARHRRRMGRRAGDATAFLEFIEQRA